MPTLTASSGPLRHKIERLVIDGMTSYSAALEDQRLYRDFFHALVGYSKGAC